MKLILKIALIFLFVSLVVFMLGGVITYNVIKREIDLEQQRFLQERLTSALKMIEHRNLDQPFIRDKISIIPLDEDVEETELVFSDTLVTHFTLQRIEPHVKLDVIKKVNNRSYKISLFDLIVEEDDIEEGVRESLVKMYIILILVVLVLGGVTSIWLLKPFNQTLYAIRNFRLGDRSEMKFHKSTTKEFNKLNMFLEEMTNKMQQDYQSLKEFTENASHEMQTPLSIVSGKLELLLDANNLTEQQINLIISAQDSIQRMSKMNKALSLLTKIENKEFSKVEEVNLSVVIEKLLHEFNELIELKALTLNKEIDGNIKINMDSTLCDILVTNLFQNAIRHNVEKGSVNIILKSNSLVISNSGLALNTSPEKLFKRFKKGNQSKDSFGLGLAIVKKICDVSDLKINYDYSNERHNITVRF